MEPIRYEGVPVDQDFDRHGDWVPAPYQVVFPAASAEEWEEGAPVLTGSVLHEPVSVQLKDKADSYLHYLHDIEFDRLETGKYKTGMAVINKTGDGFDFVGIEEFTVGSDGIVTVRGDKTGHIKDGKYRQETVTVDGEKQLKLSYRNKTMTFDVRKYLVHSENGDAVRIEMTHIPENAKADSLLEGLDFDWAIILMSDNEN